MENTFEVFREACSIADKQAGDRELVLSLEYFDTNPPTSLLIGSTETAIQIAQILQKETNRFELTFDLSHVLQLRENPAVAIQIAEPYVGHIHLSNCIISDPSHPLYGDCHPPFGFTGGSVGESELEIFLKDVEMVFGSKNRDIIIGPEIILPSGYEGITLARETTLLMNKLFSEINF